MRVADWIWKTLADWGTEHVFLVTGGGAMHLNDALGRETRIRYVCNLHEQACAMAAEGYARISGKPGVVSVTTGPGGTNALTGVAVADGVMTTSPTPRWCFSHRGRYSA